MSKNNDKKPDIIANSSEESLTLKLVSEAEKRESATRDKLSMSERRVNHLQKLVEEQQEKIESLKKTRYELPESKATKIKKGSYIRAIIPDTHGCFADKKAMAAMLSDIEQLPIKEIVMMGDHLDCSGWMAKHHPFKTIQEARYNFFEEVDVTNTHLDEIQKRCKDASIHYLEGNHEERIEAWVIEQTQNHAKDAERMFELFSAQSVLHLKKRKIAYYRRTETHNDLRQTGTVRIGNCYFKHGHAHGKHAAQKHLDDVKRNVVFGHVHRLISASTSDVMTDFKSWCFGCLCRLEPIWKHSAPTDWNHGYGIQCVHPSGDFLTIAIPIINGNSYLNVLLKTAGI